MTEPQFPHLIEAVHAAGHIAASAAIVATQSIYRALAHGAAVDPNLHDSFARDAAQAALLDAYMQLAGEALAEMDLGERERAIQFRLEHFERGLRIFAREASKPRGEAHG